MDTIISWGENLMTTEIYGGRSLADYLTLDALISLFGNTLAAVFIIIVGFIIAGFVSRRIHGIGENHASLDDTLFGFLGNIARYIVLAFTGLFVLNTFGVQTTSVIAVIGAAGLAVGLALQGTLSNLAAGIMIVLFRPLKLGDFCRNQRHGRHRQGHHAELHRACEPDQRQGDRAQLRGVGQYDQELFRLSQTPRAVDLWCGLWREPE
jgi:hypothetical protein